VAARHRGQAEDRDSFCLWEDGIIGEGKITAVQHGADYENIKRTFNVEDLRRYVHLCIRFAELASAKSNITLWRELEEGGALVQVLDEIHELRQKYDVSWRGSPSSTSGFSTPKSPS